jgi:hypothetical protein
VRGRTLAVALFLGAALVHVGLTLPARHGATAARAEHARLRGEERDLLARIASRERAAAASARASHMDVPAGTQADAVARLRRSLLDSLRGQPVSGVRLSVSPASPPLAAKARVTAEGSFADVVRLSGRLVRPGAGFVLQRVRMAPARGGGLVLDVDGVSVGEDAP